MHCWKTLPWNNLPTISLQKSLAIFSWFWPELKGWKYRISIYDIFLHICEQEWWIVLDVDGDTNISAANFFGHFTLKALCTAVFAQIHSFRQLNIWPLTFKLLDVVYCCSVHFVMPSIPGLNSTDEENHVAEAHVEKVVQRNPRIGCVCVYVNCLRLTTERESDTSDNSKLITRIA